MQSEGLTPTLHDADSCSPDIEKLLQKAEFENSEQVKLIEAENQRYTALQRQLEERMRRMEELENSTKHLDEEAKMLHKHFKQSRDICESLKKTNDILNEHEEALQRKTEDLRCKTQQQQMQHQQTLEKYRNTWQRYHESYESGKSATDLRKTKESARKLREQVRTIDDKIGDLKEGICRIEMKKNELRKMKDFTAAVPALLKLTESAELYLDGRQKMSDLNQVKNKIQYAEEKRLKSSEKNEATEEDKQMACDPPESIPTAATVQEMQGMPAVDNTAVSTTESTIPPTPTWTPTPHETTRNSPATVSVNQQELTVHSTSSQCQQTSAKTPLSSVQYLLRPTGQLINQSSSSKYTESPQGFTDVSVASPQPPVHTMDTSAEHNTASNVPGFSPQLSHLRVQLTQQVPSNEKEREIITSSPLLPQDPPRNSAEHICMQNPVSPGPSARTLDAAKSPFSFAVHTQRIEQLTKSPGEGFLFRGRPMFEVPEGTEEQGKSNEPLPGFFQPFLETSQQGQTFGSIETSVSSPSVQKESRSAGESIGFFSGSTSSSSKATMSLFGSPFKNQTNSRVFAESTQSPALFQMFDQTSSESQPSTSQQSPSAFSLNFGSTSPRSEDTQARPVFSLF